jgi:hypothetical protein
MKIQMYSVKMCGLLRIPAVTSEIQEFSCSYGELKIVYFLCSTCQEAYKLCKYLNNFYIRLRGPGAPSFGTVVWCSRTTILLELLLLHGSFVTGMVFILTRKL